MGTRRVVVIGGGYAGIKLASELDEVADVTLVDRTETFFHRIAALRASVRKDWTESPFISYGNLLKRGRVLHATVTGLDTEARVVTLDSGQELGYDVAVIATGVEYRDPARFVGTTVEEAAKAFRASQERLGAAASVLVIGGGPAGVEVAAEIKQEYPAAKVTLVELGERLLDGDHNPKLGQRALARLRDIGVDVRLGQAVSETEAPGRYQTAAGDVIEAEVVIWATGTKPNTEWLRAGHADWLDEAGRVTVDEYLRPGGLSDVFAVGDVNNVAEAKIAQWAAAQGKATAPNIRAVLDGKPLVKPYKPATAKMLGLALGPDDGLMLLPIGKRGMVAGPRLTRAIKSRTLFLPTFRKALGQPAK